MKPGRPKFYDKLIHEAVELFKEYGYTNVSVNQICKAAGIPRSSFYSAYTGKDDFIFHLFSDEFTKDEQFLDKFAMARNDFDRIWILYDYYISLAILEGPVVTGALMIIELNRNAGQSQNHAGIFDVMMKIRKWAVPLCENCQKLGIIRNSTRAEELVPMVSAALNNTVYEWCRLQGSFELRSRARKTAEALFDVLPEFRWSERENA